MTYNQRLLSKEGKILLGNDLCHPKVVIQKDSDSLFLLN